MTLLTAFSIPPTATTKSPVAGDPDTTSLVDTTRSDPPSAA